MNNSSEENDIGFECVRPIERDARLIMEWRNDPETLRMSYHSNPKVWESFFKEFKRDYFNLPGLPPLFAIKEGKRIAFLRFYQINHPLGLMRRCCGISINVAPSYRAKGIGTLILREIQFWCKQQGYDDLYSEVKIENSASQKVFEKAGFKKIDPKQKNIEDIGQSFEIIRYLAALAPEGFSRKKSVYIIAEAGSNWWMGHPAQNFAMAKALIDIAARAGADAVKFQVYKPETTYVSNAGQSDYLAESGIQEDITTIFADRAIPYALIPKLADYCTKQGIAFMASAFSPADFAAIDPYVPIHKIASYELSHIHLLELAARSGKPLILSTGASNPEEIAWAVNTYRDHGGKDLSLMHCTACYPAKMESMNLNAIRWLHDHFQCSVGLSDHSRHPFYAPVAAVALGATIIEKHFTLSNALPGPDHAFALTPDELTEMVQAIRSVEKMLGLEVKDVDPTEEELRNYARRGIQAIKNISVGDTLLENVNFAILRPGKQSLGIHPKYIAEIEGKIAAREIPIGAGLQKGDWR